MTRRLDDNVLRYIAEGRRLLFFSSMTVVGLFFFFERTRKEVKTRWMFEDVGQHDDAFIMCNKYDGSLSSSNTPQVLGSSLTKRVREKERRRKDEDRETNPDYTKLD